MFDMVEADDTVGAMKEDAMRGSVDNVRGEKASKEVQARWN